MVELSLTQGEILMILASRERWIEKTPTEVIAAGLGVSNYTYMSRLYQKKTLTRNILESACKFFKVHPDVFESKSYEDIIQITERLESSVKIKQLENAQLMAQVEVLEARLEDCHRKNGTLEASKN